MKQFALFLKSLLRGLDGNVLEQSACADHVAQRGPQLIIAATDMSNSETPLKVLMAERKNAWRLFLNGFVDPVDGQSIRPKKTALHSSLLSPHLSNSPPEDQTISSASSLSIAPDRAGRSSIAR